MRGRKRCKQLANLPCEDAGWKPAPRLTVTPRFASLAPDFQPFADFRLKAAVHRLIVTAILRQVSLLDPALREVVAILVALPPAQLLGAAVTAVAQVLGDRQRPARAHVLARLGYCHRGSVRLGGRGDVGHRL